MAARRIIAALPLLWAAIIPLAAAQGFGPPSGGTSAPATQPPPYAAPPQTMQPPMPFPPSGMPQAGMPQGGMSPGGMPPGGQTGFGPPPQYGFPGSQSAQVPPPQERQNYAEELTDFGVPPQPQMQRNVGSPTPTTIPGGHVITTAEMRQAVGTDMIIVDVLAGPPHPSLPGALMMPGAGDAGTFEDGIQQKLWGALSQATQMNPNRPIVFLCAGSRCWESYNAALRAEQMGFKMVLWYRGGLGAWQAAGLPMGQGGRNGPPPSGRPGFPPS